MKVTLQIKARSIWKGLLKIHKEIVSLFFIEQELLFLQADNISMTLQGKFWGLYSAVTEALQRKLPPAPMELLVKI